MTDKAKIQRYDHPAGGWGALSISAKMVLNQHNAGRAIRSLLRVNQPDGFDCPGCAWPEPKDHHAFEFCENGVKAVAWEATGKRVTPAFFDEHTVTQLLARDDHWLESQGRLTHPMRYNPATDKYEPIAWDAAFRVITDHLNRLASPDEAVFYTSGRTSNEAAFLYQLFVRLYGTNNLPDCSNMCHESSGAALSKTIGIGKGTVTLEDFELADAIFVIGQNPGTNHPRMLSVLQTAARRGCKIVAINPLRERGLERFAHPQHVREMLPRGGSNISSHYVQPLIGGDLALLTGMVKILCQPENEHALDKAFIAEHTSGFEALRDHVLKVEWNLIERESGVPRKVIEEITGVYIKSRATIVCWAMGLTQHKHAVPTIQMIVNLLLLRGNLGRPGAGACPVRGHSNVQGDRTMGITEMPGKRFLGKLGEVFGFTPPSEHGYDVVAAMAAMAAGKAKVFISMGGNFAAATPDTTYTEKALRNCTLIAQISTKLNRSHLVIGPDALILPCLGRTELDIQAGGSQQVTVEDSMSMVHASGGKNLPASPHLLSEPAIVAGMAKAVFGVRGERRGARGEGREAREGNSPLGTRPSALVSIDWDALIADYGRIREKIEQVMPELFAGYNEKIRNPGGFHLRNSAREREWRTLSGKAQFTVAPIPCLDLPGDALRLMTIRSHDQYNTTIYDLNDRYRGVYGTRHVVFMNGHDIIFRGLRDGDKVDLIAVWGDNIDRRAAGFRVVEYDIPQGCCAAYFPETNILVAHDQYADVSRTPVSKFIPVRMVKSV